MDAVSVGDNLTDAYRSIVPAAAWHAPAADALIMSGGSIGLYAADIARVYGAGSRALRGRERAAPRPG